MTIKSGFWRRENGNISVIAGLAIIPILGFAGLAVDVRMADNSKAFAQSQLDLAVLAGGRVIKSGGTRDQAKAEVVKYVEVLTEGGREGLVCELKRNVAPIAEFSVYGELACKQSTSFAALLGRNTLKFSVRAKSRFREGTAGCVLSLGPSTDYGISAWGSASVAVEGCSMISNVTNSNSVQVGGSGSIRAACVYSAGGVQGNVQTTECDAPVENDSPVPDPYANVNVSAAAVAAMPCKSVTKVNNSTDKMEPGRYCGKISLKNATQLVDGGVYYIDSNGVTNAGLTTLGQSASITGKNVTLIFMNNAKLNNSNGGTLDLSAPTTGQYAGVSMFFDPKTTTPGTITKINGNAQSKIKGVIYAPNSKLEFSGGASVTSGCTQIVSSMVEFTGNSKIHSDCDDAGTKEFGPTKELFLEM